MNVLLLIYFWVFLYSWGYQRAITDYNPRHLSQITRVQLEIIDFSLAVVWPYWIYRRYIKGA